MKIGVIGDTEAALSLAEGLLELGHEVMVGSHSTVELQKWHKHVKSKEAHIGTSTEAASFAELAFLATAWRATEDVLQQIRPELAGKILIDITTPLEFEDDGPPKLAIGHDISGGEMVQQSLPDSHVIKTLNFISHRHIIKPSFSAGKPVMFVCGNNPSARLYVAELLAQMGWQDVTDIGDIEKSRLLEPLCALWIEYGLAHDTWDHAFSVLNK
jgi:predicted dinucleotide-binding enzyme